MPSAPLPVIPIKKLMPPQLRAETENLPLVPRLDTRGTRKIACTSLRPGDWLGNFGCKAPLFLVLQNSAKLARVEIWNRYAPSTVYAYTSLMGLRHLGQGKRRTWRKFLPRFIRRHVCKYSLPTP